MKFSLLPRKLKVALSFETFIFGFVLRSVLSMDVSNNPLLVVSPIQDEEGTFVSGVARIYTKREDSDRRPSSRYHEADLEDEIPC